MARPPRPITRTRRGRLRIRLAPEERDLLRSLPGQFRELMSREDDPALKRLFPPAYLDDPERSAEFDGLMRQELLDGHRAKLDLMEATIDATELDEEEAAAWLGTVNDLRLALGTMLDVTEELYEALPSPDDPDADALGLYLYLGWLEEQIVAALAEGVDPGGSPNAPAPPPGLDD